MATTLKNTASGARRNVLSKTAIRYVGFITAFIGIMILLLGTNITSTVIQLIAIAILLVGVLLTSGNAKKLFSKSKDNTKEVTLYLLIGLLFIAVSVLFLVLGNQISNWMNLIFGILIALFGIIHLMNFLISRKGSKMWFTINIIVAILFIATGVLIALLYEIYAHAFVTTVGVFATVTGALGMLLY